jgi:transposase
MAYDKKFRESVLMHMAKGHSQEAAAKLFGVGTTTIKAWRKLLAATGGLEKKPLKCGHEKIPPDELRAYILAHPDAYLSEIGVRFNCTDEAVCKALRKVKIARKKTLGYSESDESCRQSYQEMISSIAKENIVFVDETGIDKYLYRPYGRAPKGERVLGKVSGKKYKRVSIVAGLCGKRIVSRGRRPRRIRPRRFRRVL